MSSMSFFKPSFVPSQTEWKTLPVWEGASPSQSRSLLSVRWRSLRSLPGVAAVVERLRGQAK